jgi:hypothetical protein
VVAWILVVDLVGIGLRVFGVVLHRSRGSSVSMGNLSTIWGLFDVAESRGPAGVSWHARNITGR